MASAEATMLRVPFPQREAAKAAGAKWDKEEKAWFAPPGADMEALREWLPGQGKAAAFALAVPYSEREEAKALGAFFDRDAKAWMAPKGADPALFERWKPKEPAYEGERSPQRAFADALRQAGLDEPSPEMDGKLHRVALIDGKKGSLDGAYIGHLDGVPAGFIQNFKTGLKENWSMSAPAAEMSPEQRAALKAQADLNAQEREREIRRTHEETALRAAQRWERLPEPPAGASTPYLDRKGIRAIGARIDGDSLVIPAADIDGKIWTLQTIPAAEGGKKLFMKGGKKLGCMRVLGEIRDGQDFLIAEGFATGASLHEATGLPVAVAFDSGNLLPVAQALASRYPASFFAFMADDDRFGEKNVGMEKAYEAAMALGAGIVAPEFASLEGEPTDFNDLALRQSLGEVKGQAEAGLEAERRRLRAQFAEKAKEAVPEAKPYFPDWKASKHFGKAVLRAPGFLAVDSGKGWVSIHEASRLDRVPKVGQRAMIEYERGRAKAKILGPARDKPAQGGPQM